MFEQLNGSFNQEERKTLSSRLANHNTPEKGDLNSKQSLKSTIIISESPMARLKTREDEFFSGSSEVESAEQSFEKYGSSPKIISSDVWDTPRTEKSVESKASSRKSKVIIHHFRGKKDVFIVKFGGISGHPKPIERYECYILSRRVFNGVAWRIYLSCTYKGFGIF